MRQAENEIHTQSEAKGEKLLRKNIIFLRSKSNHN